MNNNIQSNFLFCQKSEIPNVPYPALKLDTIEIEISYPHNQILW